MKFLALFLMLGMMGAMMPQEVSAKGWFLSKDNRKKRKEKRYEKNGCTEGSTSRKCQRLGRNIAKLKYQIETGDNKGGRQLKRAMKTKQKIDRRIANGKNVRAGLYKRAYRRACKFEGNDSRKTCRQDGRAFKHQIKGGGVVDERFGNTINGVQQYGNAVTAASLRDSAAARGVGRMDAYDPYGNGGGQPEVGYPMGQGYQANMNGQMQGFVKSGTSCKASVIYSVNNVSTFATLEDCNYSISAQSMNGRGVANFGVHSTGQKAYRFVPQATSAQGQNIQQGSRAVINNSYNPAQRQINAVSAGGSLSGN